MGEKGISLVALIVTIIIIIILATLGGFYSSEILDKGERMNLETELRNVDELVANQKARIMAGEIEIPDAYIASDSEIDEYLGSTTSVDKSKIKGSDTNYYLMDQTAFSEVFGGDINVKDIRREYLVNFEDKVIILNAGGKIYKIGDIK